MLEVVRRGVEWIAVRLGVGSVARVKRGGEGEVGSDGAFNDEGRMRAK